MKAKRSPRKKVSRMPSVSDAEWVVMKVVWEHAPVTANQVVQSLEGRTDWKPKTIQTLLSRLARKGAVRFEKKGREYLFSPLIEAEEFLHSASRSFLSRFFNGGMAAFLATFLEREKLSPEEIDELKRILEEKK
jgi:BlaI family transcriptional regulator, penicillinase repressor